MITANRRASATMALFMPRCRRSWGSGPHAIKRAMALLEWLVVAVAAFGGLVAMIYVAQRSLMYFPERLHTPPAMAGLPEAQEVWSFWLELKILLQTIGVVLHHNAF
jgi:hypothetical protein